jgi:hypothetical protein
VNPKIVIQASGEEPKCNEIVLPSQKVNSFLLMSFEKWCSTASAEDIYHYLVSLEETKRLELLNSNTKSTGMHCSSGCLIVSAASCVCAG